MIGFRNIVMEYRVDRCRVVREEGDRDLEILYEEREVSS